MPVYQSENESRTLKTSRGLWGRGSKFALFGLMLGAGFALMPVQDATAQQSKKQKEDPNIRSVEGIVVDADQKPVDHAVVFLKDLRSLDIRTFSSAADGTYHFSGLRADVDYELEAKFMDMKSDTKRLTVFDSRKSARIILQLKK